MEIGTKGPEIKKSALIVVDMQNDFVHADGSLACKAREVPEAEIDMPFLMATISSIPSYSLRHKRIEQPHGNSGRNRGVGVIGGSLRSCGGAFPHLDGRRVCLLTPIRELLWSSGGASRTRQSTTF